LGPGGGKMGEEVFRKRSNANRSPKCQDGGGRVFILHQVGKGKKRGEVLLFPLSRGKGEIFVESIQEKPCHCASPRRKRKGN